MLKNPSIPKENSYYYEVLYGALLHDIGKFFWRADKTQPSRYSHLSKEDIGLNLTYFSEESIYEIIGVSNRKLTSLKQRRITTNQYENILYFENVRKSKIIG